MKSIIDALYDTYLTTIEDSNDAYMKAIDELVTIEEELNKASCDCKALIDKYQSAVGKMNSIASKTAFRKGFVVGVQLMLEVIKTR